MSDPASYIDHQVGILFVSSSLYGAFVVLFVLSTLVLHHQVTCNKRSSSGSTGTTVYLSLGYLLFAPITLSWILSWFFFIKPEVLITAEDGTYSVFVYVQNATGYLCVFIADWILVFRLYIIWEKKKAVLWGAAIVSLGYIGPVIRGFIYFAERKMVWSPSLKVFIISSLCINVVATSLIIWKIWARGKLIRAFGNEKIIRMIAIVIESAALPTAWLLLFLIIYFVNVPISHIFLYGTPSISGIATALVNVRVGLGWAAGEEGRSTRSLHNSAFSDPEIVDVTEDDY